MIICTSVKATPYIPSTPDEIVAEWSSTLSSELRVAQTQGRLQPQDPKIAVQLANAYLTQATQPGYSRLYGLAQAVLKPHIEKNTNDSDIWLSWAQVQQHQHRFFVAQEALKKILVQQPNNITANLIAARLYLIQDNPAAAQTACLRLLGHADLITLSVCSLEARSLQGEKELADSFAQLQKLSQEQGLPGDERQTWVLQILADMAMRLNQPQAAVNFLEQSTRKDSLSYWVQWADAQLATNNPQAVMDALTKIISRAPEADDALLIRLTLAEKKLNRTPHWQLKLAERVQLREARDDQAHAADLAIYYLDIIPVAEKALYWAERNWQKAREPSDKQLLARAQQFISQGEQ
jgi:predicted Zn-dependent protease